MTSRVFAAGLVAALLAGVAPLAAAEPESCASPRFSDVGWTDISATTAVAGRILTSLGYEPRIDILSVAVTYEALPRGDVDIFLGNWMPLQEPTQKPLVDAGRIDVVRANLEGALIGLAVPKAAYDAGLRTYADIAKFGDAVDHRIYGIEAGSSANATILDMIKADKFGLKDFTLVESSEQAMLAQVKRAARSEKPIVFFGWRPHPMNVNIEMDYLTEGDDVFGPDDGAARVLTNTRPGYLADCPNVGRFLSNLVFSVEAEDLMMSYILDDGMTADAAAEKWLRDNPAALDAWLDGVTTREGAPGVPAARQALGL
ncbi:choline ABC transporter substrate-binding protein [Amaricoccus solimangrovi]|uniref:Choline ABC transporter substrate-binding protein n=1 Tax=Amaricoccus solimangrovi TaxID=2589815 RepID=A0A501WPL4_9RHOB|nr:choline ABC transporter substrate-binding protein [Amaricoccus solimangrovi]TPE51713.1 choline ABC transporter substrate-binding protein [Amaricoccus solimangrovi]